MSGVDLIIAALTAGASAGVTNTATAAVQDAYAGLKSMIAHLTGDHAALAADESDAAVLRSSIADDLIKSGADRDDDILAAALDLLAQVGSPAPASRFDLRGAQGVQIGDDGFQSNTFN